MFKGRPTVLEELLDCLFHIARADGKVSDSELDYLRNVANIFGLSDAAYRRIHATIWDSPPRSPMSFWVSLPTPMTRRSGPPITRSAMTSSIRSG